VRRPGPLAISAPYRPSRVPYVVPLESHWQWSSSYRLPTALRPLLGCFSRPSRSVVAPRAPGLLPCFAAWSLRCLVVTLIRGSCGAVSTLLVLLATASALDSRFPLFPPLGGPRCCFPGAPALLPQPPPVLPGRAFAGGRGPLPAPRALTSPDCAALRDPYPFGLPGPAPVGPSHPGSRRRPRPWGSLRDTLPFLRSGALTPVSAYGWLTFYSG